LRAIRIAALCCFLFMASGISAEREPSLAALLSQAAQNAAFIFLGDVQSITRQEGAMIIVFRVKGSYRGAFSSDTFELREWPGLWAENDSRFIRGEQGIYFLRAAGANGFSSLERRFNIVQANGVVIATPTVTLDNRSRRLRTISTPATMPLDDFEVLLRRSIAEQR
jgi:hypothetical protein